MKVRGIERTLETIVLIAITVLALGFAGYYMWSQMKSAQSQASIQFASDEPIEVVIRPDGTSPTGFTGYLYFAVKNVGSRADRITKVELAGQELYRASVGPVPNNAFSTGTESTALVAVSAGGGIPVDALQKMYINVTLDPNIAKQLSDLYPSTVRLTISTASGSVLSADIEVRLEG